MRICTDPWVQGMERLIREAFAHVEVIGPHVEQGHFDLLGPQGEIILPHVWDTVVEPDWTITMHMWPMSEEAEPEPPPAGDVIDIATDRSYSQHPHVMGFELLSFC